ncbi:MAG: hypothetical protein AB9Q19_00495 [Candidatus Reddybacter sp.]
MNSSDKQFYIGGAVVLGLFYYFGSKAQSAIGSGINNTLEAFTPTSSENLLHRGINAVGDIIDDGGDNDSFSFGSWIYDFTHQRENDYFSPVEFKE